MYFYKMYGMTIASPIRFYECEEIINEAEVDATFEFGLPPQWVIDEYKEGKYSNIKPDIMWFRLEDELLIYVENGSKAIIWKIDENIQEARLHTYVLSGAVTFLLFQRSYMLIHGSALEKDGEVFIISGPSGSGKSTTAKELMDNYGYTFASDDICAVKNINNETILFPGPPWQRVCADVMERDKENTYTFIQECGEKYGRVIDKYISKPMKLKAQFIITKDEVEEVSIHEITGVEKINALSHNLFRGELHNLMGMTPDKLKILLQICNNICIYEVVRPNNKDTLTEVVEIINKNLTN